MKTPSPFLAVCVSEIFLGCDGMKVDFKPVRHHYSNASSMTVDTEREVRTKFRTSSDITLLQKEVGNLAPLPPSMPKANYARSDIVHFVK